MDYQAVWNLWCWYGHPHPTDCGMYGAIRVSYFSLALRGLSLYVSNFIPQPNVALGVLAAFRKDYILEHLAKVCVWELAHVVSRGLP